MSKEEVKDKCFWSLCWCCTIFFDVDLDDDEDPYATPILTCMPQQRSLNGVAKAKAIK